MVGGLLVALAAMGIFAAYQGAGDDAPLSYVVATADIAPGQTITAAVVGRQPIELPESVAIGAFGPGTDDEIIGSVAVGPVSAGELVQRSSLRPGGTSERDAGHEVSFEISASRALNGSLQAGELVDVVATIGSGSTATTERILRRELVVAIGAPLQAALGVDTIVVTVALDDADDAVALAAAVDTGRVTVVRSPR